MTRRAVIGLFAGGLVAAIVIGLWWARSRAGAPSPPAETARVNEPADTVAWREQRLANLTAPDGWLSVAGLFFPEPGRTRLGSDPANGIALPGGSTPPLAGHVIAEGDRLWLELEPGVEGTIDDVPIRGRVEMRPVDADGGEAAARVRIGRLTLQAHRSGSRLGIRLRDPESPIRTGFTGLRWYPIGPRWRVAGRFVPYTDTRTIPIQNVLGDVIEEPSPGEVEFALEGHTLKMVAIDAGKRLWFVFRDATAGSQTYSTRFLYADKVDHGTVILDFNRAYNPPCAFNPHTTCPLPPPENRLPVAIEAGEKLYEGPDVLNRSSARPGGARASAPDTRPVPQS